MEGEKVGSETEKFDRLVGIITILSLLFMLIVQFIKTDKGIKEILHFLVDKEGFPNNSIDK